MTKNGDEIRAVMMAEHRVAKAVELLERIAKHDHQGLAAQVLRSPPSGSVERTKAYAEVLSEVASTDIQSWARDAIRQLKGEST